ncbi:lyase family protein [Actinoplanes sp. KI2]|uniref:lyase family protein n=1 Tax=Actinoplanes sp. KI2 TaxID=2983315 RepID=UPI0021D5EE1B|nr:lyase family protein [Actinoplanes sp. KI2]MCU7727574.1 lyase family protein [Actinoplanes sp. KI2]
MTDLLWPGDARAGDLFTDESVVAAMVAVESAWLAARGFAPQLSGIADLGELHEEGGGNPVIPLLGVLRSRNPAVADHLHTGLTSQDVLDTALVLCLRSVTAKTRQNLDQQVYALARLADRHRRTRMVARTLTQHAIPTTFGLKAATWLNAVLDARETLAAAADLPVQIGGAAGTLAAPSAIAGSPESALGLVGAAARLLGLRDRPPWHTARAPFTRIADAFVTCTDAWGKVANDVLLASRPEIGELSEPVTEGRGGSSAMPNKRNPVLSVLIRRAALAAPPLAATMHLAAATAIDERPDGAWHVEWATLRTLSRRTVVAAEQTTELVSGLVVHADRMATTLAAAYPGVDAERRKIGGELPYLGANDQLIDAALARAEGKP